MGGFPWKLHWTNVISGFFTLSNICDKRRRPEGRPAAALITVPKKESGNLPCRASKRPWGRESSICDFHGSGVNSKSSCPFLQSTFFHRSSLLHIVRKRVACRTPPANRHHMHMAPFIIDADVYPYHVLSSCCTAAGGGPAVVNTVTAWTHTIYRWSVGTIKVCDQGGISGWYDKKEMSRKLSGDSSLVPLIFDIRIYRRQIFFALQESC